MQISGTVTEVLFDQSTANGQAIDTGTLIVSTYSMVTVYWYSTDGASRTQIVEEKDWTGTTVRTPVNTSGIIPAQSSGTTKPYIWQSHGPVSGANIGPPPPAIRVAVGSGTGSTTTRVYIIGRRGA
jgi:hypothetical protein